MSKWYKLVNKKPVQCTPIEASNFKTVQNKNQWQVSVEEIDGHRVSTVFLTLDHNYEPTGRPVLFETMIFSSNPDIDGYQDRCCTWEEAERMHESAKEWLKSQDNVQKINSEENCEVCTLTQGACRC